MSLQLALQRFPYAVKRQKKYKRDGFYIIAYKNKRSKNENGKSVSRTEVAIHMGSLEEDGSISLSKQFLEQFPLFKGKKLYCFKNTLCSASEYRRLVNEELEAIEQRPSPAPEERTELNCAKPVAYNAVAKKGNLKALLKGVFGNKDGQDLYNLCLYQACSGDSLSNYNAWLASNYNFQAEPLSPQRISELLERADRASVKNFFQECIAHRLKASDDVLCLAMDGTSLTVPHAQLPIASYGYNKQDEKAPQVNMMNVVSAKTYELLFSSVYDGSINDMAAFKEVFAEMLGKRNFDMSRLRFCLDRGFASSENIRQLLNAGVHINMGMIPLSDKAMRERCLALRTELTSMMNFVMSINVTARRAPNYTFVETDPNTGIEQRFELPIYIYFDPEREARAKRDYESEVCQYLEARRSQQSVDSKVYASVHKFMIERTINGETQWEYDRQKLEERAFIEACTVLAVTGEEDLVKAYKEYRNRNAVEVHFDFLKNEVGARRTWLRGGTYHGALLVKCIAASLVGQLNNVINEATDGQINLGQFFDETVLLTAKYDESVNNWVYKAPPARVRELLKLIGVDVSKATI